MSALRDSYKVLSILGRFKAASRGPKALAKNTVRRHAHRGMARAMRRSGL